MLEFLKSLFSRKSSSSRMKVQLDDGSFTSDGPLADLLNDVWEDSNGGEWISRTYDKDGNLTSESRGNWKEPGGN